VVITNAKTTGGGAAIHDKEYMNGTSPVKKPLTILERMFSSPILRLGEQQLKPTIIFRLSNNRKANSIASYDRRFFEYTTSRSTCIYQVYVCASKLWYRLATT
jgi:hypothetical protein